jgi:hypothetical protein
LNPQEPRLVEDQVIVLKKPRSGLASIAAIEKRESLSPDERGIVLF